MLGGSLKTIVQSINLIDRMMINLMRVLTQGDQRTKPRQGLQVLKPGIFLDEQWAQVHYVGVLLSPLQVLLHHLIN